MPNNYYRRLQILGPSMLSYYVLRILAILLLSSRLSSANTPVAIKIEGAVVETTIFGISNSITYTNWFVAEVDDRNTRIQTGHPADTNDAYLEYGTLSQDSYLLLAINTNKVITEVKRFQNGVPTTIKLDKPTHPSNMGMLYLDDGRVPVTTLTSLNPIWLAYAAGRDLKSAEKSKSPRAPIFSLGDEFRQLGEKTKLQYKSSVNAMSFLEKMTETVGNDAFARINISRPAKGTFTNCTYETLEWANVEGIPVPKHFFAVHYDPRSASKRTFDCTATNIIAIRAPLPENEFQGVIRVVERRHIYTTGQPVVFSYTTKDEGIWNKERVWQEGQRDAQTRIVLPRGRYARYLIYAITLTAVVIPVLIAVKTRRMSKNA